jgi:autotransporter-associated beta strand protein
MGALILNGSNSYAGGTVIQQGQIQFGAANSVPTTGNILLAPDGANTPSFEAAAAIFNFAFTQTQLGAVSSSSVGVVGLGIADSSTLDFSSATGANLPNVSLGAQGNFTYSGTITPWTSANNGGYQFGGSGNQSTTGGSTLTVSTNLGNSGSVATGLTVDPSFSGFGAGSVTLSGVDSYTGRTTVNTGVLTLTGSLASSSALTQLPQLPVQIGPGDSAKAVLGSVLGTTSARSPDASEG